MARAWGSYAAAFTIVASGCGRVAFDALGDGAAGSNGSGDGAADGIADGFFVEIAVESGSRGGVAGADAECLNVLTARAWLGKAQAMQANQLAAANVAAWLCTTASCRNLKAGRTYRYASSINTTRGGATFVATASGFTANDGRAYGDNDVFGSDAGFQEYFTGRRGNNTPQTATCGDWTSTAGQTDVAVNDVSFYPEKLSKYGGACNASRAMICIVDAL